MSPNELIAVLAIMYSVVCGLLSYLLAEKKNQEYVAWFFAGLLFGILGLIAAAGLPVAEKKIKPQ